MISELFQAHKLNALGLANSDRIGEAFTELLACLESLCGGGRHFAVAKTKLEEAAFFARKAMASLPQNQLHDDEPSAWPATVRSKAQRMIDNERISPSPRNPDED